MDALDHALDAALHHAVQAGGVGAVAVAGASCGGARTLRAAGTAPSTLFDLASVTKIATAVLTWRAHDRGDLDVDAPLCALLPDAAAGGVTLRALLAHRSGLPAWAPWFRSGDVRDAVLALLPGPEARVYSDAGFLLLGFALEAATGLGLHDLLRRDLAAPLGLAPADARAASPRLGYRPRPCPPDPAIPATGHCRPRAPAPGHEALVTAGPPVADPGEVDDDNAWALDGVAGHAGAFGDADALLTLGEALLDDLDGAGRLLRRPSAIALLTDDRPDLFPPRTAGLDRRTPGQSALGATFGTGPRGAAGHHGFTGTSLWLDLDHRAVVALLTARTFTHRHDPAPIKALRQAVHDAVAASFAR